MTVKFETEYMDRALFNLEEVIDTAEAALTAPEVPHFDTFVGTGFSGGVVIPALALRMGKKFVLIRKEDDSSHHGRGKLLGELGEAFIFVDDFVSSGRTRGRVLSKLRTLRTSEEWNIEMARWDGGDPVLSTFVGQYMYAMEAPEFEPAETSRQGFF